MVVGWGGSSVYEESLCLWEFTVFSNHIIGGTKHEKHLKKSPDPGHQQNLEISVSEPDSWGQIPIPQLFSLFDLGQVIGFSDP